MQSHHVIRSPKCQGRGAPNPPVETTDAEITCYNSLNSLTTLQPASIKQFGQQLRHWQNGLEMMYGHPTKLYIC